ncbi:UNVERIFIED_CONTAM: hypothetical protein Scaly_1688600 [Sesamum calycinum]|uniref:Uncharacterized protein n=1 Tax=Sesamum calycinum TaxID=2727403 RepID=A0AAW2NU64_9LAMI
MLEENTMKSALLGREGFGAYKPLKLHVCNKCKTLAYIIEQKADGMDREKGKHTLSEMTKSHNWGYMTDLFGCGIGWFSQVSVGFLVPLMWYHATILYFGNYYRKDPRNEQDLPPPRLLPWHAL